MDTTPLTDALIGSAAQAPSLAAALMEAHAAYAQLERENIQLMETLKMVQQVASKREQELKANNTALERDGVRLMTAYDRVFNAAFAALEQLNSARYMWNGPIHKSANLLLDATGPQG